MDCLRNSCIVQSLSLRKISNVKEKFITFSPPSHSNFYCFKVIFNEGLYRLEEIRSESNLSLKSKPKSKHNVICTSKHNFIHFAFPNNLYKWIDVVGYKVTKSNGKKLALIHITNIK